MNSKQFGIIFTLLGLIVCVSILAIKLNKGGINNPGDLASIAPQTKEVSSKEKVQEEKDFFYDSRSEKEQGDAEVVDSLKAVVADKNTSKDQKKKAQDELVKKSTQTNSENRIEINVKNQGFEDAICYIEGDRAKVFVKSNKELDTKTSVQIQEIVEDVANISDVYIEVKK
ncbi:SpoIIIAH-like family protein [Clostridium chrysemydis]|uniref:SpoIIIAH-like family protein n=1 Tax=Clostridium chrysemydis TaxID=2665504 RepID=UPI00188332B6|nr:SpoIIIAH-like family protein [Clostridium chrysemydis]